MEMLIWYSPQALSVMNSLPANDRESITEHIRGYGQPVHIPGEMQKNNIGRFGVLSISKVDPYDQHFEVFVHSITVGGES